MYQIPTIKKITFFWFRRDLRLDDNPGLLQALSSDHPVVPLFIFDDQILSKLESKDDSRVTFIWEQLQYLKTKLHEANSDLLVLHGNPMDIWKELLSKYQVKAVYANEDYEPYGMHRDREVGKVLAANNISFELTQDHVMVKPGSLLKADGKPYTVYTPFSKKWNVMVAEAGVDLYLSEEKRSHFLSFQSELPSLDDIGFTKSKISVPCPVLYPELVKTYHENRDFPAQQGTTLLGPHLRFGTVSARQAAVLAMHMNQTLLNELAWREFFIHILWHFPHVSDNAFRPAYDRIDWENNEAHFLAWKQGKTGIPIVDAGMRELLETGNMHNRVRMIVASFLTKNLLIDWRWGAAWFAQHLLDYELASNNGNWQWAAGTGCDAAPYFRVFNPVTQQQKFDPEFTYVEKWVPEWKSSDYPKPIVDLKATRARAIERYKKAFGS